MDRVKFFSKYLDWFTCSKFEPGVGMSGIHRNLENLGTGEIKKMGTGYRPEKKILGTDGYRVPARKKILGTDGYRVPARKKFLGMDGYWVPGKFSLMPIPGLSLKRIKNFHQNTVSYLHHCNDNHFLPSICNHSSFLCPEMCWNFSIMLSNMPFPSALLPTKRASKTWEIEKS